MLIPHQAESETDPRHGRRESFAQLRRQLSKPSELSDGNRQRLLELARRLARIQALGDEYARVDFSESAAAAIHHGAAVG